MGNDRIEIIKVRRPAELRADGIRRCHNRAYVAGPPLMRARIDGAPADAFDGVDHLPYRIAAPIAAIEHEAATARAQMVKRLEMCSRQISNVDVVAHACAIRRVVI